MSEGVQKSLFNPSFVEKLNSLTGNLVVSKKEEEKRSVGVLMKAFTGRGNSGLQAFITRISEGGEADLQLIGFSSEEAQMLLGLGTDSKGVKTRIVIREVLGQAAAAGCMVFRFNQRNSVFGVIEVKDFIAADIGGLLLLFKRIGGLEFYCDGTFLGKWGEKFKGVS